MSFYVTWEPFLPPLPLSLSLSFSLPSFGNSICGNLIRAGPVAAIQQLWLNRWWSGSRWPRRSHSGHLTCGIVQECLPIRPSPNPSAMNNFHGRCTLITFPFKWHCGGLSRSLISARILLQAFYCWQTKPPKSPKISSAWLSADFQQPLLHRVLLCWPEEKENRGRTTLVSRHERGGDVCQPASMQPVRLSAGVTFVSGKWNRNVYRFTI